MNEAVLDLQNIDSQEKAFLLFRHVILGASFDYNNNFYVKHSSLLEATYISEFNKILESECRAKGLLEEKNKLKVLFENTSWSKEQEGEYQEKLKRIQDLEISKKKLVIPFQIKYAQEFLNKEIAALSPLFMEREDAIGLTVESHCNNKNYIGMESRGQFLEYWIKQDYINNFSTMSFRVWRLAGMFLY